MQPKTANRTKAARKDSAGSPHQRDSDCAVSQVDYSGPMKNIDPGGRQGARENKRKNHRLTTALLRSTNVRLCDCYRSKRPGPASEVELRVVAFCGFSPKRGEADAWN